MDMSHQINRELLIFWPLTSHPVYSNDRSVLNLDDLNILSFDLPNNISISVDDVFNSLSALYGISSVSPDGFSGKFLFQL
jgi:hypothetical protein